jgi:hypothetical protein
MSKLVGAWLSTEVSSSDQAAYESNASIITHIYPINGGEWDANGALVEKSYRLDWAWPQGLPAQAQTAGQVYMPVIGCTDPIGLLENPEAWDTAITNLLASATGRFDAPWAGVMFDIEGGGGVSYISDTYRSQMNDFYSLASEELHNAGLLMAGWFWN